MPKNLKLFEVLKRASLFLEKNNCEPKAAEMLLKHYLDVTNSQFHLMMRDSISQKIADQLNEDLKKHVQTGIPVQYLIGYEYFFGRKFFVNEDVLIPRPETEELVDFCLHHIKKDKSSLNIADIGTGSGVIAITIALECPEAMIYATDLSRKALHQARKNAKFHQANLTFLQGNFLKPIIDKNIPLDYIIANPPYIKTTAKRQLSRTVKHFEPEIALFAGEDGLSAYRTIIQQIPHVATEETKVLFEIGFDQGEAVSSLIKETFPKSDVQIIQDMNRKDRVIFAQLFDAHS